MVVGWAARGRGRLILLLGILSSLFLPSSWGVRTEMAVGADGQSHSEADVELRTHYESLLTRFGRAFNDHDAVALVSMMTEDAVFRTSGGPEGMHTGVEVVGKEALTTAFETTFATFPDARWVPRGASFAVMGEEDKVWRGASEWTFQGTRSSDGANFNTNGVDLFTFRDGLISIKDAFRKDVPPTTAAGK